MDPDALKSDLIIMKSILQKNTGLKENSKQKEVKQNSVEQGYFIIGSGGRGEGGGGDESGGSSENGDGVGVDEKTKGGKKEEKGEGVVKVEKEGVRQCLSSKCLVEQLPNTLSVSFKGQLVVLSFLCPFFLTLFIYLFIYTFIYLFISFLFVFPFSFHFYSSVFLCYQLLIIFHPDHISRVTIFFTILTSTLPPFNS